VTNRPWFIYALKDPSNGDVRYVGISYDPSRRLRQHISAAPQAKAHKDKWINSLIRAIIYLTDQANSPIMDSWTPFAPFNKRFSTSQITKTARAS